MTRLHRHAVPVWASVMALLVCAPLVGSGYVLSYDMVWVPHLALTRADVWGLGSALPRAVPSDVFAGLLGSILPAVFVQKIVLLAALFLAGLGMGRLLRGSPLVAQLAAMTMFVWNPFVAERLVLGHWPLLLAYAAVPWLIDGIRDDDGVARPKLIFALVATALTPATGLMGALIAFATKAKGQSFVLGIVILAVNAPWVVAGFLHTSIARTDGSAVTLFDVQPEGSLGRVGAALSLGGIWNVDAVPSSRGLTIALVFATVLWSVMLVGLVSLWSSDRRLFFGLGGIGLVGLALALSGWLAPHSMADLVRNVPAAGLLRDGTRYLLLLAPLEAVAFGFGVQRLIELSRTAQIRQFTTVLAVLVPIVALPDLAWGVGGALKTTDYPKSWYAARSVVDSSKVPGDILILPFSSYRQPSWNHHTPVLDPAGRFFPRETVTNDVLLVSGKAIAGEDPRAARIGRILATAKPANALAKEGIGLLVVETDAGKVPPRILMGMARLGHNTGMGVFATGRAVPRTTSDSDRLAMIAAWTVTFLALWFAGTQSVLRRVNHR